MLQTNAKCPCNNYSYIYVLVLLNFYIYQSLFTFSLNNPRQFAKIFSVKAQVLSNGKENGLLFQKTNTEHKSLHHKE